VRELIDLVFYASLVPEEGRHPRFKLVSQKFRSPLMLVELGSSRCPWTSRSCTASPLPAPDPTALCSSANERMGCTARGSFVSEALAYAIVPGRLGNLRGGTNGGDAHRGVRPRTLPCHRGVPGYEYRAGRVQALTGFRRTRLRRNHWWDASRSASRARWASVTSGEIQVLRSTYARQFFTCWRGCFEQQSRPVMGARSSSSHWARTNPKNLRAPGTS